MKNYTKLSDSITLFFAWIVTQRNLESNLPVSWFRKLFRQFFFPGRPLSLPLSLLWSPLVAFVLFADYWSSRWWACTRKQRITISPRAIFPVSGQKENPPSSSSFVESRRSSSSFFLSLSFFVCSFFHVFFFSVFCRRKVRGTKRSTAFRGVSVGNFDRQSALKRRTKRFQKISREFFSLAGSEV